MSFPQFSGAVNVFFSYASSVRQDKNLFKALITHLAVLKQQGRIVEWYDSALADGHNRQEIIELYFSKVDLIILLVSADFLASRDCQEIELKQAFERLNAGAARIISVILRPVSLKGLPLESLAHLPDSKAVSQWKDKDAAFLEIVNGIRKVIETQFVGTLARLGSSKEPLWNVPHRYNPFFTGRDDLLTALHTYFIATSTPYTLIQALSGLGGMGKTQIAFAYASRYRHEYQSVLWMNADSRTTFVEEVIALANLLGLPEKDRGDQRQLFTAVKRWLERNHRWLLLLDNLDNVDDFTLVDQLVPTQGSGHVLLTTRLQTTGSFAHVQIIPPMSSDESTLFLLRRAQIIDAQASLNDASPTNYAQARRIAQEVDGFPLALDQAGAYIDETKGSPAKYLTLYRQRRAVLLKRRGHVIDTHPQSVTATLSLAFERATKIQPAIMQLLYLFAFLHPDTISDEMLMKGAPTLEAPLQQLVGDPLEFDMALENLLNFSLVHRHADTTTSSIHRIVQAVLKDQLTTEQQSQWASSVIRLINHVFPEVNFSTWSNCLQYLPQAQICAEHISAFHLTIDEAAQLLHRLGSYYYERGQYTEAEECLSRALDIREQASVPEELDIAQDLNALALVYNQLGKYQLAEQFVKRALAIHERILGDEDIETSITLNNLALIYQEQGQYALAEPLYTQALAIQEQTLGSDHPDTATTLNNTGLFYQEQGKYDLAEPLYQRSLALRENILEAEHPDIAQSLNNLGTLYQEWGNYQQAEPFLQRALAISEQTLGPDHPDTAQSLNNLALVYRDQKKYQQAEALYRRALDIYERVLDPEHPDLALTLNNLGQFYYIQGNVQQACSLLERAVAICEQAFGPEHPYTAHCLSNLAEIYVSQHHDQQAETLYLRALAIYKQAFGPEHPEIATVMECYASLLESMKKPEKATELRLVVRTIRDKHH
jgi:tetratricopeptide (TPR) repeat protein